MNNLKTHNIMETNEITAADYQQAMSQIWNVVRGYCSDDEEAKNTITMAVENYLYDIKNGSNEFRAIQTAMDELYVEPDYMMEFAEGIFSLQIEPSWDDENDECDDVEEWVDEYAEFVSDQHLPFLR